MLYFRYNKNAKGEYTPVIVFDNDNARFFKSDVQTSGCMDARFSRLLQQFKYVKLNSVKCLVNVYSVNYTQGNAEAECKIEEKCDIKINMSSIDNLVGAQKFRLGWSKDMSFSGNTSENQLLDSKFLRNVIVNNKKPTVFYFRVQKSCRTYVSTTKATAAAKGSPASFLGALYPNPDLAPQRWWGGVGKIYDAMGLPILSYTDAAEYEHAMLPMRFIFLCRYYCNFTFRNRIAQY